MDSVKLKLEAKNNQKEEFNYERAFSRNLGWVTKEEQKLISQACIAIPGMGGVGGHHLHALLRMGFRRFKLADLDSFEVGNFNRQFGATMSTIGDEKLDTLANFARDIIPDCELELFPKGVQLDNMEAFLEGVDIVADSLDLYASHLRTPLYGLAAKKGIKVISAGPFGMGSAIMAFDPDKMSFNEYFDLDRPNLTMEAKIVRFLAGMAPTMMHRKYIEAPEHIDLFKGKLPSLHVGCYAAAGVMGSTIMKMVLGRGEVIYAPHGIHYDFYLNKTKKFWRPFGNRNFIQRIFIKRALKMFQTKEFK